MDAHHGPNKHFDLTNLGPQGQNQRGGKFGLGLKVKCKDVRSTTGGVLESESFPQLYDADHAPRNVVALMDAVLPQVLEGSDPVHAALRDQRAVALIEKVELSGAGFFVTFRYESPVTPVTPADFAGGDAHIILDRGTEAGCVTFVRDGRLSMFEVYTSHGPWTVSSRVAAVDFVFPIPIPESAVSCDEESA